jgi:hypothetical protein
LRIRAAKRHARRSALIVVQKGRQDRAIMLAAQGEGIGYIQQRAWWSPIASALPSPLSILGRFIPSTGMSVTALDSHR